MQRINEVVSRIQTIQAQVERPPISGAFQSLLDARLADGARNRAPETAAPHGEDSHTLSGPVVALAAFNRRAGVTLGQMMAGPQPVGGAAASGVGATSGVAGYRATRHVPDGSVMTAAQLDEYMRVNQIEARNGRLQSHELTAVSGSWHGNGRLLAPAAEAWELMRAAAAEDGIDLKAIDTYRTWESQERAYRKHLSGEKKANVLPPGKSRHGAGLAIDVTNGHIIDRNDREWQWLDTNARAFGWHPISNEAWHWEFRGV